VSDGHRRPRRPAGPVVNDISGPATTHRQVGGAGVCRWKMLMNGTHLEGDWNCVEYLVIEPGAGVGEHVHPRMEEIYYIASGRAVVTMDGVEVEALPGDLITTPVGSSRAVRNRGDEEAHVFVTGVFPGEGEAARSAHLHVPALLEQRPGHRTAEIDLTPHFTGDWQRFRLLDVPAGGVVEETRRMDRSVVLHVIEGTAAITTAGSAHHGGAGLTVAVPPGFAHSVRNTADGLPVRLISVEVAVA
jgi:mannose-6-phosphate isomerase-like protein (cupin superfamily)